MNKLIVCIQGEADGLKMAETGIYGHETEIKPYRTYLHTDAIICKPGDLDLIMKRLSRYHYQVYGGTATYLDVTAIRRKMNRAFFKEAVNTYGMRKSDAKKWSRAMTDGYFFRSGYPISELIETFRIDYESDFSQASFDSYVIEEISYW